MAKPAQHTSEYASPALPGFSPHHGSDGAGSNGLGLPELDFGLAEQLFSEGRGEWGSGGGGFGFVSPKYCPVRMRLTLQGVDGGLTGVSAPIENNLFDPWYPFPPLGEFTPGAWYSARDVA